MSAIESSPSVRLGVSCNALSRAHRMNLVEQDTHPIPDCRIAYLAGYFDGEGCITVSPGSYGKSIRVCVVSGDCDSVFSFSEVLGGDVIQCGSTKTRRLLYRWLVRNDLAVKCLRQMLPHLKAKREQALLVLGSGWKTTPRGGRISEEQKEKRDVLDELLREAKRP